MARSRRSRRAQRAQHEELDVARVLHGMLRRESKRDGVWNVQEVSGANSTKTYVCPGCSLSIEPGTHHVVAWRADGLFGEAADIAERRHWHRRCWQIA